MLIVPEIVQRFSKVAGSPCGMVLRKAKENHYRNTSPGSAGHQTSKRQYRLNASYQGLGHSLDKRGGWSPALRLFLHKKV